MARETIWLNIGCILASFNIEKPLDINGVPFEPSVDYSLTFLRCEHNYLHNICVDLIEANFMQTPGSLRCENHTALKTH